MDWIRQENQLRNFRQNTIWVVSHERTERNLPTIMSTF